MIQPEKVTHLVREHILQVDLSARGAVLVKREGEIATV